MLHNWTPSWQFSLDSLTLEDRIGCPTMSVTNYQSVLRNIPEEQRPCFCYKDWLVNVVLWNSGLFFFCVFFICCLYLSVELSDDWWTEKISKKYTSPNPSIVEFARTEWGKELKNLVRLALVVAKILSGDLRYRYRMLPLYQPAHYYCILHEPYDTNHVEGKMKVL